MELDCGIRSERITSWLGDELSLPHEGEMWGFHHAGGTCHVSASPLPARTLGTVSLERTLVSFSGDLVAVEEFSRLFTLRFMSAGG